jgi:hypothetical protein
VLVYEIAERTIESQFSISVGVPAKPAGHFIALPKTVRNFENDMLEDTEARHEVLLKHSFLTEPFVSIWDSIVFDCFRQLPAETPLYSLNPPFLFYSEEVASFQSGHGEELIGRLADNIALLDRTLRERYNCMLVFIPIPNKITVYSRLATRTRYDEFLPLLCRALRSRGVCTVELLPRFAEEKELLYWPTDTHWNNFGIRLAVEETRKRVLECSSNGF